MKEAIGLIVGAILAVIIASYALALAFMTADNLASISEGMAQIKQNQIRIQRQLAELEREHQKWLDRQWQMQKIQLKIWESFN